MYLIYFEQITVEFVGIIQDDVNPHGGDAEGDGENLPTSATNPPLLNNPSIPLCTASTTPGRKRAMQPHWPATSCYNKSS